MIFLDHAATTPVRREAIDAMLPYLTEGFGNPSSRHSLGGEASRALAAAREDIAAIIGCRPGDVVFTGGGTEADNLAVKGIALANPRGRHVVVSQIEHEAVLEPADYLERLHGFDVSYLGADENGWISPESLAAVIRPDTTLVSVQLANNEIGTVQPIAELAEVAHGVGAVMHTDAVQAAGWLPLSLDGLGVDALTLAGHKLGAPKGVGALVARGRLVLEPVLHGGGQERGRRSGTENVAGGGAWWVGGWCGSGSSTVVVRNAVVARVPKRWREPSPLQPPCDSPSTNDRMPRPVSPRSPQRCPRRYSRRFPPPVALSLRNANCPVSCPSCFPEPRAKPCCSSLRVTTSSVRAGQRVPRLAASHPTFSPQSGCPVTSPSTPRESVSDTTTRPTRSAQPLHPSRGLSPECGVSAPNRKRADACYRRPGELRRNTRTERYWCRLGLGLGLGLGFGSALGFGFTLESGAVVVPGGEQPQRGSHLHSCRHREPVLHQTGRSGEPVSERGTGCMSPISPYRSVWGWAAPTAGPGHPKKKTHPTTHQR